MTRLQGALGAVVIDELRGRLTELEEKQRRLTDAMDARRGEGGGASPSTVPHHTPLDQTPHFTSSRRRGSSLFGGVYLPLILVGAPLASGDFPLVHSSLIGVEEDQLEEMLDDVTDEASRTRLPLS